MTHWHFETIAHAAIFRGRGFIYFQPRAGRLWTALPLWSRP
jgi:hypothetical protein